MQSDFRRSFMGRRLAAIVALLIFAGVAGYLLWGHWSTRRYEQTSASDNGNYSLITQDGLLFERASLQGRPYLTYFGYASCPDRCPAMLTRLSRIRTLMGWTPDELPIVFITVDPAHDTPKRLAAFAKSLGVQIIALTGDQAVINRITDNAGVFVQVVPQSGTDYRIEHTTKAFLYNVNGDFWDTISPTESDDRIKAKLREAALQDLPRSTASVAAMR